MRIINTIAVSIIKGALHDTFPAIMFYTKKFYRKIKVKIINSIIVKVTDSRCKTYHISI